jgi:hypothetical protein
MKEECTFLGPMERLIDRIIESEKPEIEAPFKRSDISSNDSENHEEKDRNIRISEN